MVITLTMVKAHYRDHPLPTPPHPLTRRPHLTDLDIA